MVDFERHRFRDDCDPFDDAPPWAVALRDMLAQLLRNQETEMSDVDDLNVAVTDLQNEVTQIGADMDAQVAALQSAAASNDAAAMQAATANIRASVDALKAAAARDMPQVAPAQPVQPAPTPAPAPADQGTAPTPVPADTGSGGTGGTP